MNITSRLKHTYKLANILACIELAIFGVDFFFGGGIFRKCVLPEGLAKTPPNMMKLPTCLDLIDYTMVLTISICKFDAENTPNAFKHAPDLV